MAGLPEPARVQRKHLSYLVNHMKAEEVLSLEEGLKRYEVRKGAPLTPEEIAEAAASRESLIKWLEFQAQHSVDGCLISSLTFVLADGTEVKDGDDFHAELVECTVESIGRTVTKSLTSTILGDLLEQLAQDQ